MYYTLMYVWHYLSTVCINVICIYIVDVREVNPCTKFYVSHEYKKDNLHIFYWRNDSVLKYYK